VQGTTLAIVAVLIVAAAAIYAIFLRDRSRAVDRLLGRSETIETSFGTLEYAVAGEGEPLLIVHGAAGGFDQGIEMADVLARVGYRLIVPSRFGYLRSTLPADPTTSMQADAYAQLLDHLGVGRAVVVAISAGAWSSLQFAIRYPERCRALALLVPADYLPEGTSIRGGVVARAVLNSDFVAWAALKLRPIMPGGMTRPMLGTDPGVVRSAVATEKVRVEEVLKHVLPISKRLAGMQFDIRTAATHEPYQIEQIVCPVLSISAEDDRFGTASRARYIADRVPNGKAVIFRTGGHALVGRYADALREVTSFFQAVQKCPSA
jgi:2-hydroxy-6-oxonona-2,4-dienedioate hydrolase